MPSNPDPTRFSIGAGLYVGDRPIPWASIVSEDIPDAESIYRFRSVVIPFESGDALKLSWSTGSYSDNYAYPQTGEPFEENPKTVEVAIDFADDPQAGEIVEGWQSVPQVLQIINTLAAPRPGFLSRST